MKKIFLLSLSVIMACSMSLSAIAAPTERETKTVEVALEDVIEIPSARALSVTKTLAKDYVNSFTTGQVTTIGQIIDLSSALPEGSYVTKVTIYCPKSVKVTQSRFTAIENYIIDNGDKSVSVKFWQTDTPPSTSKTTELNGTVKASNSKWKIQIQGRIAMNESGMDGFTVNSGSKIIIEYN